MVQLLLQVAPTFCESARIKQERVKHFHQIIDIIFIDKMKVSLFLTISSVFGSPVEPVQFIDFWTENDVFALQIRQQFSTEAEQDSFWTEYDTIRKVMEFYQNSGDCDYFFQNPSFDEVEEEEFDEDLSPAENIENLVKNIDNWLNSYSCVGFFGEYEITLREAVSSLRNLNAIAADPNYQPVTLEFTLSSEMKDYHAAMASCFLDDERLAELDSPEKIAYLEGLLPADEKFWVVGGHECTTRVKDNGETDSKCNEKNRFVCANGVGIPQSSTTTTTATTTTTTTTTTTITTDTTTTTTTITTTTSTTTTTTLSTV